MRRYHELDALRGFAMLLGVVFHAALGSLFIAAPESAGAWLLEWLTSFAHSFRMPLFFVIAGFFAAMLADRMTEGEFVKARLLRIGVPLIVGLVTVGPLTDLALATARREPYEPGLRLFHLWFLAWLIVFYAGALLGRRMLRFASPLGRGYARAMLHPVWRLPLGVAVATVALAIDARIVGLSGAGADRLTSGLFFYYGVFFFSGWFLWGLRERVHDLGRNGWGYGLVALALSFLLVDVVNQTQGWAGAPGLGEPLAHYAFFALTAWCAIFALFALARRFAAAERRSIRYVVDSSYWLYLVHLPLVAWFVLGFAVVGFPWWAALVLTTSLTTIVGLVTYAVFVRHRAIGSVLHGPRERRVRAGSGARPAGFEPATSASGEHLQGEAGRA